MEIGAIRICSIVPFSFSLTMDSAVDTTAVIMARYAINPGTRNRVLRSSGLYQMRGRDADELRAHAAADPLRRFSDDRVGVTEDGGRRVGVLAVEQRPAPRPSSLAQLS